MILITQLNRKINCFFIFVSTIRNESLIDLIKKYFFI